MNGSVNMKNKNPENLKVSGTLPKIFSTEEKKLILFKMLKRYHKLCGKDRKNYILYLPVQWINGYNVERVSLQLGEMDGDAIILINLTELSKKEHEAELNGRGK
jgi:hypothetical protein